MKTAKRNYTIDTFKAIACWLVVINHYHSGGRLGTVETALSHLGVPYFFLILGYYFYDKRMHLSRDRAVKKIKHIGGMLLCHVAVYYIDNMYQRYVLNHTPLSWSDLVSSFCSIFTPAVLKQSLIWSTGLFGTGQWFLVATLQAYILFSVISCVHLERAFQKLSPIIGVLLLTVHVPVRLYAVLNGGGMIAGMSLNASASVRNVWFDAIPFMCIGIAIRYYKPHFVSNTVIYIGLYAAILSILEASMVKEISQFSDTNCVLYLGTVVAVVCFFAFAISNPNKMRNVVLEWIGDKLSMIVFFIHPIVGFYLKRIFSQFPFSQTAIFGMVFPLILIVSVTALSFTLWIIGDKVKKCFGGF